MLHKRFKYYFAGIAILLLSCCFSALATPFVTADLQGQLGNQLFEIAAAYSLALDNGARPVFPDLATKECENIPLNYKKVFWRLDSSKPFEPRLDYYKEPHFQHTPIPYHPNMAIFGYFQSEKYFAEHKEEIIALFAPHEEIVNYLKAKYSFILSHPCSVALHVRTYFKEDSNHTTFMFNGIEYISKAIKLFPKEALFVIFSDNIAWCKEHLSGIGVSMYFMEGEPHYLDFYLMSMCRHNIISNSSFSWWAAYLNRNPEKRVIAPKKWFSKETGLDSKDLVPEEWITLE